MYRELSLTRVCGRETEELENAGREEKPAFSSIPNAAFSPGFYVSIRLERGNELELGGTSVLVRIAVGLRFERDFERLFLKFSDD